VSAFKESIKEVGSWIFNFGLFSLTGHTQNRGQKDREWLDKLFFTRESNNQQINRASLFSNAVKMQIFISSTEEIAFIYFLLSYAKNFQSNYTF